MGNVFTISESLLPIRGTDFEALRKKFSKSSEDLLALFGRK